MADKHDLVVETDEYRLRLKGDWTRIPDPDPLRLVLESESRRADVVISYLPADLPRDRLHAGAETVIASRMKAHAELDARLGHEPSTFGDVWIEPEQDGSVHLAYAGYNHETIFRFFGWVTERKFLNFWVSTETQDDATARRVFDEVWAGFEFHLP